MADDYVCTLDEASIKKAKEELHEDPNERLGHVETFRQWILQQPHIKCPTDTKYLLRFLRHAKFSQLKARQTLEGYLTVKTENPQWFENYDYNDPKMWEFLETGYVLPMKGYTSRGTRVIMYRTGSFDLNDPKWKGKQDQMLKSVFGLSAIFADDERTQVNGTEIIQDFTGFSMALMTFWGLDRMKKTTKMWQNNFPGRFKGFHYYNPGPIFETIMTIFRPLLSKKFQDRIHVHGENMENVYKIFGTEMMPDEYLPDDHKGPSQGSVKDILAELKKELMGPIGDRIRYESSPEWRIDFSKKPSDVPAASFRKLNVD